MSSAKKTKVRDKWKLKKWFDVYAPPYFGEAFIGSVPAFEPSNLIGRVVEATLYDITKQDISHMNIKLYFQIIDADATKARTIFKGHEYAREYLKSLVRRGSSRVDGIFDVETKDGYKLRVYPLALTKRRVNPSQESAIRKIMMEVMGEKARNLTFDQLVQEMILGKAAADIFNRATKIAPLKHVGIRKSKLLYAPIEIQAQVSWRKG